ncbi:MULTISPECIES: DUF2505 domain-containing protein [unclassified Nocardioides]|uniref:DUF2505 domain-containing protein n=1 Tax=unclassified Nocardioides TaxID=2615069 RepID=UPI0006F85C0F|nr:MULTISPECIES: DUF2505 domain-containing protein [unclassified Nocardioides]KQY56463.1 hypothetical protein ASD30_08970 [Nocardioides sp. Root140]KRF14300.1 hypothetical protein ASH02_08080 [Nocardioides sp. Soil796]
MKKLTHELTYPGATVEQVVAMVSDPAFREAVADYQGVVRRTVTVSGEVPAKKIEVEIVHGTDRVPSFAKKFVGDEIPIVQVEKWTSDTAADVEVTIPGKPGDMKGTARIEQRGDDVVETLDLAVQVKIPLVGGKVEDLIVGLLAKGFKAENKVGVKWLAGEWS